MFWMECQLFGSWGSYLPLSFDGKSPSRERRNGDTLARILWSRIPPESRAMLNVCESGHRIPSVLFGRQDAKFPRSLLLVHHSIREILLPHMSAKRVSGLRGLVVHSRAHYV